MDWWIETNMDYKTITENIKSGFTKDQLKSLDLITGFDSLKLANGGDNDAEGYQIFTPAFIVKDMVKAIGEKDVFNPDKTVLEPTSGDGAFTTYILLRRLERAFKEDKDEFEIQALKCLSTIYSIEMDKDLIIKQRNNILTVFTIFGRDHKIDYSDGYLDLVRCMILTNFMWAMFNADIPATFLIVEVAYKMPEAEKGKMKSLEFPVWDISGNGVTYHMEGAEINYD